MHAVRELLERVSHGDASEHAECPQRDSNPCSHLERVVTWTTSRWGLVEEDSLAGCEHGH